MVALGTAAVLAYKQLAAGQSHQQALRDRLHALLEQYLPGTVHLNGHPVERLPNTLHVSIDGVVGEEVLAATPTVASSTGSACHEGSTEPSAVLMAMGLSRERALGALRLTLGRWSTAEEVEISARSIAQSVNLLRQR